MCSSLTLLFLEKRGCGQFSFSSSPVHAGEPCSGSRNAISLPRTMRSRMCVRDFVSNVCRRLFRVSHSLACLCVCVLDEPPQNEGMKGVVWQSQIVFLLGRQKGEKKKWHHYDPRCLPDPSSLSWSSGRPGSLHNNNRSQPWQPQYGPKQGSRRPGRCTCLIKIQQLVNRRC